MTTETRPATLTFNIDPMHTSADFSIRHMMISNVRGSFRDVSGEVVIDEANPENSRVEASIGVKSVDTGVAMRDDDLRSANFFDADNFPAISFRSTGVERVDEDTWKVRGDLTIRDVTQPVVLQTEFGGRTADFYGKDRIGFTAETSINRKDFGLTYNAVLESGGVVVGDKVKITLHVEAVKDA